MKPALSTFSRISNFSSALIVTVGLFSTMAAAATVNQTDPKKQLGVTPGDYVVTDVDLVAKGEKLCTEGQQLKWSPDEDQALCDKGAIHPIQWSVDSKNPILSIGQARSYSDFNAGLKSEPPISSQKCVLSHNTQSQNGKLIDDSYTNCTNENTSTHAEIEFVNGTLEYTQVTKITHGSKVICIPLKCTLKPVKKQKP